MSRKKRWFLPWWMRKQLGKRGLCKEIRERDGDNCWRCHSPMRFGQPFNRGKAATLEHLLPKGHKDRWKLENLVLCHGGCNRFLGTNTPEQKERMRLRR